MASLTEKSGTRKKLIKITKKKKLKMIKKYTQSVELPF